MQNIKDIIFCLFLLPFGILTGTDTKEVRMGLLQSFFKMLGFDAKQEEPVEHPDPIEEDENIEKYLKDIFGPVEYDEASKVRFAREDKKIQRLRQYFNPSELKTRQ